MEKKRLKYPVIVEGKYDKITLLSIYSGSVITTGGFSVFNSKEKQSLLRKLCEAGGIILLTDSDAGGRQIRTFLSRILPKDKIFNLYIPEIKGKERRKSSPSKAGILGVEGMDREVLTRVLDPFTTYPCEENAENNKGREVTKLDFYTDGLSGGENSAALREKLAKELGLPHDMTAKALIEAINLIYGFDAYRDALSKIKERV